MLSYRNVDINYETTYRSSSYFSHYRQGLMSQVTNTTTNDLVLPYNLSEVIEDMFMVLNDKEKDVIVERFSLDSKPKRTLESIGQKYDVTRERIRQIENIAISKLRRTLPTTKLKAINDIAKEILNQHGGVLLESTLVSLILKHIDKPANVDKHIITLSMRIDDEIRKQEKTATFHVFWYLNTVPKHQIKSVLDMASKLLKAKSDVIPEENLIARIINKLSGKYSNLSPRFITSALAIDNRFKEVEEGWGLTSWRHINPKSIRDKAYIVLKNANKPLHFVEIANRIIDEKFDKKVVTTQAVHNELIRYDQFVLIGRGLYALKEWGYESGTVADVIESILKKASRPLHKRDIIEEVGKQRTIKVGTISLNLQNNPKFIRVGRAVYALKK